MTTSSGPDQIVFKRLELNTSVSSSTCPPSLQSAEVTRKMLRDRHNKKNPTQPNPVFPNWVYDRPALIGDFITGATAAGDPEVAIGMNAPHISL